MKLGDCKSGSKPLTMEVPFGEKMRGPWLWLIDINNSQPKSTTIKFAHDVTLVNGIEKSVGNNLGLQGDLNYVAEWATTSSMLLPVRKTHLLTLNEPKVNYQYTPCSVTLFSATNT